MNPPIPQQFIQQITALDVPQLSGLITALDTPALTAVRVNALKGMALPPDADRVAWCDTGYYLDQRPAFTLDPAMHQGLYYVQEASSMIQRTVVRHVVELISRQAGEVKPLTMLDACAAPGGKTACAIESLPAGSVIVANELSPQRAAVLVENIIKHGSPDTIVTCGDARCFGELHDTFDIIAVDAPCSGEGMMRKESVARSQWTPDLVADCSSLQRDMTDALWRALKPGGYMIYSTCTFNRAENEEIAANLITSHGAEPVKIAVDPAWNIVPAIGADFPCMRFIPGTTRGEGLFLSVLRKSGSLQTGFTASSKSVRSKHTSRNGSKSPAVPALPAGWLNTTGWTASIDGDQLYAMPPAVAAMEKIIGNVTRIRHRGVEVAHIKGGKLIPSQGLAMSVCLAPDAFARAEVDKATALDYLRRQAVTLPEDTPTGHVLLTYNGYPLGFVNNLGSRANNLYPPAWRILSTRISS